MTSSPGASSAVADESRSGGRSEVLTSVKKGPLYAEHDIGKLKVLQCPDGASSNDSIAKKYAMSVMAASVAEFVTYPLDLTKTRLQLQGEIAAGDANVAYRGMFGTAVGIIKEEGMLMLWRGILPALYRHAIYTGIRMSAYEEIRNNLQRQKDGFALWKKVIAGMTAGGVGQLVASPTDLIKTQVQMEGRRRRLGKPPRVNGAMDALKKIIAQGGVRSLWRGCLPNVQRAALVNLGDLSTYDTVKRMILKNTSLKDNSITHCLSSGCAGLVGATMGTPADVVKARIMNQPVDAHGRGTLYKNSLDCLVKTVHNEGLMGLYKGFVPCWLRMAPWSLTFWLSFEKIRRLCGAKSW